MRFSIIVVCLNAGDKLNDTLDSIFAQDFLDYEVVVKDGGSKDGSIEGMRKDERIRLYVEQDKSIYDAMNQAVGYAKGEYIIFLNCGDSFHDGTVLTKVNERICEELGQVESAHEGMVHPQDVSAGNKREPRLIVYGKLYNEKTDSWITPAPVINGFTCYRNVPCHQSCIYDASLCKEKPFEIQFKIRGDYEHFLWCYYKGGAKMVYLDATVADYEGGGYSETKENLKRSKAEHKEITARYMSAGERFKYKAILLLTLAPLRTKLANSKRFAGMYHKLTAMMYGRK